MTQGSAAPAATGALAIHLVRHGASDRAFELRPVHLRAPGSGEVRIIVRASGLNYADVMARLGLYPDAPPMPAVLGYEASGVVESVGPGVTTLKPGDRVLAFTRFGGYANRLVAPADQVVPLPAAVSFEAATALATQGATAWVAAEHLVRLREGDHVLVHAAAGGVGLMLTQLAKRRGCIVYATASTPEKREFARRHGADHVIPSREGDFVAAVREIQSRHGGRGIDVIFDSLGGSVTRRGLKLLAPGGRLVGYGVAEMTGDGGRKSLWRALKTVAGFGLIHPVGLLSESRSYLGLNMLRIADGRPALLREALAECVALAARGELATHVGGAFPAREVARAHDLLASRGSSGKVVLQW